jgi:uncharacterized protein HemX
MMKTKSSKTTGRVIGSVLMVIGAGALVGFFSSKKNRSKSQEKLLEFGNFILGKVNSESKILNNKAKELVQKIKNNGENIDGLLSRYEKTTS